MASITDSDTKALELVIVFREWLNQSIILLSDNDGSKLEFALSVMAGVMRGYADDLDNQRDALQEPRGTLQ
jgi:hypothetical protein